MGGEMISSFHSNHPLLYRYMKYVIITLLFLILPSYVYADQTSYQAPSTVDCGGSDGTVTQCSTSNLSGNDLSPVTYTGSSIIKLNTGGYSFNIPTSPNIQVDGFKFKGRIKTSTGGWSFFPYFSPNGGTNFYQPQVCSLSSDPLGGLPCQYNTSTGYVTANLYAGNTSAGHTLTPAEVNSSNFNFKWQQSSSVKNAFISLFELSVLYSTKNPNLDIDSVIASKSAGTIMFDASGDTFFTQAGEQCKIVFYQLDTSTNPARLLTSAFATVTVDANNPRTSTGYTGTSTYLGYGFTSTTSTWFADQIIGPYTDNANTAIATYTSCWHQDTNSDGSKTPPIFDLRSQSLNPNNENWNPDGIASPSALQNNELLQQPACDPTDQGVSGWICSIKEWGYNTLTYLFSPQFVLDSDSFTSFVDSINTKAPFAYAVAVFNLDFSSPSMDTVVPSMTLHFPAIEVSGQTINIPDTVYTDDGSIANFLAVLRPYQTLILWIGLVAYFISVASRLFEKGGTK